MLVLGATGSGKSFLLNFLLTHAQKYEPLTVVFDLGHSYRKLATLLRGSYLEFALRHIAHGWVTIVHNDFQLQFSELPGGGASMLYAEGDDAEALNKVYPEATDLHWRSANLPPFINVNWRWFVTALRSRHVEMLLRGE